ncbi:helix-turn-helix domain-containing protein [Microbacterium sp. EYE_5]|uniref:helix-turn-helix domain-containing protein n=1 Tax=unclassified Microbacterium TaxID=2609290 RepID=UPI002003C520|nr:MULTISPECIES: helix-turn-helix domain-containing protein [unclassified Microbacterium]MCK6080561.1 helix-turn-helix domain-containing protein [Microbacterium sp. EYE_382]MCK6085832.1 helix-turn-helix domain-containing protein [Microbacterium sp. EYE_384]MCK6124670.1 helix-turn-helix domain-containing protein [Microbacterium sp. EYE_80]MCK6127579.1 helix-turn-helix domain-containing protein [Microbacterium sp. EYE_79]MCK6141516.1 helix-turn-helix domain-containing protein [Microbacterium sp.
MTEQTTVREDRKLDAGALRALAHPLRVQLFDILSQYGPQTASSLAERTGESSGSTSYHLRALAKQELIREIPERGSARERWWERSDKSVSFDSPEALASPGIRSATQLIMTEFLGRRQQQLMRHVSESIAAPDKDDDGSAMISTANIHLTRAQARDMIVRLSAIVDEVAAGARGHEEDPDRLPFTVRVDVFALPEDGDGR